MASGRLVFIILTAAMAGLAALATLGIVVAVDRSFLEPGHPTTVRAEDVVMTILFILLAILFTGCTVGIANFKGVY